MGKFGASAVGNHFASLFRPAGEIHILERIGGGVVELLVTVLVTNVAPVRLLLGKIDPQPKI